MNNQTDIDYANVRILLVDDEPFIRKLIARLLFDNGFKLVTDAENGLKAIKAIKQSKRKFDFIICDLEMPEVSGLEFLKIIRKTPELNSVDTPVIILTGHSDEENIVEAVLLGIHGFLTKPVSRNDLLAKVKLALTGDPVDSSRIRK